MKNKVGPVVAYLLLSACLLGIGYIAFVAPIVFIIGVVTLTLLLWLLS